MRVFLLSVIGSESIKDCDYDFVHPDTSVMDLVCGKEDVADKLAKFVNEVDAQLRELQGVLGVSSQLGTSEKDDDEDDESEDEESSDFDVDGAQTKLIGAFTEKFERVALYDVNNHFIAERIVDASVNRWAESWDELLNGIRVQIVAKEVLG